MTQGGDASSQARAARWDRVASGVIAFGGLAVLGIARWLSPAAEGHSTHTQLGLEPCTFLSWTGQPCPLCGATTTFSLLAHGRWLEGLATQPFAALLFAMTVGVVGVAGAEAIWPTGRWKRIARKVEPIEGPLAALFLVALLAGWTYKIVSMN